MAMNCSGISCSAAVANLARKRLRATLGGVIHGIKVLWRAGFVDLVELHKLKVVELTRRKPVVKILHDLFGMRKSGCKNLELKAND